MALYMLDTDVASYMIKGTSPAMLERLRKHQEQIGISVIPEETILITNNMDHFSRIPGLKIENLNVFMILFPGGGVKSMDENLCAKLELNKLCSILHQ